MIESNNRWWNSPLVVASGLIIVTLALFYPVVHFEYVYDDIHLFLTSSRLTAPENIWHALTQPFIAGTFYFRPLVTASFISEFSLFGVDPAVSHALNLTIFCVNVVLVFKLAEALFRSTEIGRNGRRLAGVGAVLYASHLAMIEPVAWVSGRFDLAVTAFTLWACLIVTKPKLTSLDVGLATLAFFLAALGKETVVLFPVVALLLRVLVLADPKAAQHKATATLLDRPTLVLLGALLIAGLLYLVFRFTSQPLRLATDWRIEQRLTDPWDRLAFTGQTLWFYIKLIFWPFQHLSIQSPFDPSAMTLAQRWVGLGVLGSTLGLTLVAIAKRHRIGFLFVIGLLFLLPVLNLIPLSLAGNIGHSRFLSLPLAFFVIATLALLTQAYAAAGSLTRVVRLAMIGFAALWFGLTILNHRLHLNFWRNQLTLWGWSYQTHPQSVNSQFGYLSAAIQYRQFDLAKKIVDDIEAAGPIPPNMDILIGLYLLRTRQIDESIRIIEQAVKLYNPPHLLLRERGISIDEAQLAGQSFVAFDLVLAYSTLCEAYNAKRNFATGFEMSTIALFYQRDFPNAHLCRSFSLYGLDQAEPASLTFEQALRLYGSKVQAEVLDMRRQYLQQLCGPMPGSQPESRRVCLTSSFRQ